MSSYLAAAALNTANRVVTTLDEQLKAGGARRNTDDVSSLASQPVAAVGIIETDEGFGYGALKIEIVLGRVNRVGRQTSSVGDKLSEFGMLEFDNAYRISFMPQITLAFQPTYSGETIREELEEGGFISRFMRLEDANPVLMTVSKYLTASLESGVVMQPNYAHRPVTVVVHEKVDIVGQREEPGTQLFRLSPEGLSQLEMICRSSWRQTAAS